VFNSFSKSCIYGPTLKADTRRTIPAKANARMMIERLRLALRHLANFQIAEGEGADAKAKNLSGRSMIRVIDYRACA
jgi:hypothetical protein